MIAALSVRVDLHHDHGLDPLRAEWDALLRGDPQATPFVAPGWGRAWLEHWAGDVRPWVLTVRDGGELVGLAALALARRGPARTLMPLGSHVGNYWDVLARPEQRSAVNAAVADALMRRRAAWDALVLDTLPGGSGLGRALERAGLRLRVRGSRPYPGLALPGSFEAYLAGLPRGHRSNLRRHLRPLERGELRLLEVREPPALRGLAGAWQDIRERWWRARGKDLNPDHSRPQFAAFLAAMLAELVPAGRAVAWELRRGDDLLGISVNLCDPRAFYWWLSGFEPDTAGIGPGKLVIGESIRRSIAAGRSTYDFMVGSEPYKYWFGGEDRRVPRVLVGSSRPRSLATAAAARVADARRLER